MVFSYYQRSEESYIMLIIRWTAKLDSHPLSVNLLAQNYFLCSLPPSLLLTRYEPLLFTYHSLLPNYVMAGVCNTSGVGTLILGHGREVPL